MSKISNDLFLTTKQFYRFKAENVLFQFSIFTYISIVCLLLESKLLESIS